MEKSSKVNLAIFSAGLMTFIGILNETSINVTYPLLVKEFHQPLATVQWITTAYLLTVTIVMGTTAYLLKQVQARWLHLGAALSFICGCIEIYCYPRRKLGLHNRTLHISYISQQHILLAFPTVYVTDSNQ